MTREKEVGCPRVSVPTLFEGGGARVAATCAAAAFAALFAAADPVYGPDYGPTDFSLPGAFATTNSYPVPTEGTVRYVAPNVPRGSGNGTSFSSPWNLYDALNGGNADHDTTLILSGGVYRVAHDTASGLVVTKRLTIQPYLDQQVWLKGSTQLVEQAFTPTNSAWYTPWTLAFTNILAAGDDRHYYIEDSLNPIADDGDMAFDRNGQPLRQVPSFAELGPGRFCIDFAAQRLYVGDNPAEICPLEAAACKNGLLVYSSAKAVTLRGLGVAHFAGRGVFIGSASGRVENCVAVWNGNYGLNMHMATGSVVRGCTFACNGQNGVFGGGRDALFEQNLYTYNNIERFAIWNAAGHKITDFANSNAVFRSNVFERNYTIGLWFDCSTVNGLAIGNVSRHNTSDGIKFEICDNNCAAFNTVYGNGRLGIFVQNSSNMRLFNNTVADNMRQAICINDYSRRNTLEGAGQDYDKAAADAGVMWDVYNTQVANNILVGTPPSGSALFSAHELWAPGQTSFGLANAMVTNSDNNLYSRPDDSVPLISARNGTSAIATNYTELALFRPDYSGFETHSVAYQGADPFFRNAASRDYRARAGGAAVGAAAPLPAEIAAWCGRPTTVGYAGANAPWDEGWWRFDETSGQALDSVSTNHSTTVSGAYRVPGKGRSALYFDGVNDRVDFGTSLPHLNGALTVAAWVKPDRPPSATENKGRVIANTFNNVAKRGWLLGYQYGSTDKLEFQFYSPGGTLVSVSCNNFFRDWSNRWVHVTGVFKPAENGGNGYVALYTNGVLAATPTATAFTAIGTTNTNLRIGMRADNPYQGMWSGLIDEVRVFGAALNAAEIAALMPVAEGRWRFDETDGLNKALDSVNVNTGSVVSVTYTDAGKSGRALSFNGSNSRVDFTTNLMHLSNAITVSAWVKPATPPIKYGRVIANTFLYGSGGNASRRGWLLGCQYGSTDVMQFQVSSPTGGLATVSCYNFFRDWSNKWVHVAGVFKPATSGGNGSVELYTNGTLAAWMQTVFTAVGCTNGTNLRIGMRSDVTGQGPWSGLIDEVNIYDGAQTPAALAAECAAAPNCPPEAGWISPPPASLLADADVVLEADASEPDGGDAIARVEILDGGLPLAAFTRRPYRFVWRNHCGGAHTLSVRACDTRGAETFSPPVTVTVTPLLTAGAAGHWRFDETSGIYSYDSVGTNCGTNYNSVARAPGRLNGALSFDGSNDYVGFGTNLAHLSGALTVSAWVKPDRPPSATENKGRVIANTFNYGAKRGWLLGTQYGSFDLIQFQFYSPAGVLVSATCNNFFRDWSNTWVHVAGVFKPATPGNNDGYVALYTNGVPAGTPTPTAFTAIGTTNTNLRIGMRADNTIQGMWSGLIDEVRVFGAVLPQEELDALCSGPAGEWPFEEASTCLTASNRLENAHHGTLSRLAMRVPDGHAAGSKALSFNGSSDRVDFSTNLAHITGGLTVSAWVKPVTPPKGTGRIIANTFSNTAKRGWLLGLDWGSSDLIKFQVYSPAGSYVSATCNDFFRTCSNRWVHVAGVFKPAASGNDGYVALYTNGVPVGTPTPTTFTAIGTTNTNLRIGMRADVPGQGAWTGLIDEVRLYEGALPLFAIQALANNEPVELPGILSASPRPKRTTVLLIR